MSSQHHTNSVMVYLIAPKGGLLLISSPEKHSKFHPNLAQSILRWSVVGVSLPSNGWYKLWRYELKWSEFLGTTASLMISEILVSQTCGDFYQVSIYPVFRHSSYPKLSLNFNSFTSPMFSHGFWIITLILPVVFHC